MDNEMVPCRIIVGGELAAGWLSDGDVDEYRLMDTVQREARGAVLVSEGSFRTVRSLRLGVFQGSGDIDCDALDTDRLIAEFLYGGAE